MIDEMVDLYNIKVGDELLTENDEIVKCIKVLTNCIVVDSGIGSYIVDKSNGVAERYYHLSGFDIRCRYIDEDIINKFIYDFTNKNKEALVSTFTEGYCYWFAIILSTRFTGEIYYLPVSNHFITKICGSYYDITGKLENINEKIYRWSEYKKLDELETERITKYCILKNGED